MHIVYVIAPAGGPEAYVKTIMPYLEKLGHRVSIVYTTSSDNITNFFPDNVEIRHCQPSSLHYYLSKITGDFRAWARRLRAWEMSRAISRSILDIEYVEPVDIVEITEGIPVSFLRKRWTIVVRAHGSNWTFDYFCKDAKQQNSQFLIRLQASQLKGAHKVSSISRHLADHINEFCNFPKKKNDVIPYPVDLDKFKPSYLFKKPLTLLSVGRLEHRKGTDTLLKAMLHVWKRFPDIEVVFLGEEAEFSKSHLIKMVPPDKQAQVILPGFVNHDSLPAYYQDSVIYIAPTQYETFGYTVLEAMACGKPVISTKVGAVPELVENGKNGFLVPFGCTDSLKKAILHLLSNPDLIKSMGMASRTKSMEYNIESIVKCLENFYMQAINGDKR